MDKFLIRKKEVLNHLECTAVVSTSVNRFTEQDETPVKKTKKPKNKSKEVWCVLRMGIFLYSGWDGLYPFCVICGVILSIHSVKPSLLQRHFSSYYKSMKGKSRNFFNAIRLYIYINVLRCLQASYPILLHAVKFKHCTSCWGACCTIWHRNFEDKTAS